MENSAKKELKEIETLRGIKANVQKEIDRLQIILGNLQAQEHTAQIKDEQIDRKKETELLNKYADESRKIELKRIEAEKRIDLSDSLEKSLNSRESEIEKRESRTVDLEAKESQLNKQRANFEIYKTSVLDQLMKAQETIAEANAVFNKIETEKDMLIGREKKIKEQEKYWNDCIGMLEEDKRRFEIEKENILGLKKAEVSNA